MTKAEYNEIVNAIYDRRRFEKFLADEYIKDNPDDKTQREFELYLIWLGLDAALHAIEKRVHID